MTAKYVPITPHDWMTDANCATTSPDAFFPELGSPALDARKVCAECPVKAQCAEYALNLHVRDGIWGGVSARTLRRRAA
jgi:hypothetical protein